MNTKKILMIDAVINISLGILLLLTIPFPETIPHFLGVPTVGIGFYASIMGSVLVGIGIALLIKRSRQIPDQRVGLELGGAIAINLCGGTTLFGWLIFGKLDVPGRGKLFLWMIAFLLFGISSIELILHLNIQNRNQ